MQPRAISWHRPWRMIRLAFARIGRVVFLGAVVFATLLLVRAFDARRQPDLKPWHTVRLQGEFHGVTRRRVATMAEYLELEKALFEDLDRVVVNQLPPEDRGVANRYFRGSPAYTGHAATNWNRTVVLEPDVPRGGVLLLHGLTDSPYSMRHLARIYGAQGYFVVALRIPGHGTIPAELMRVNRRDWNAAVRLAARHVRDRIGPDLPFHMVGYSNGGALALQYALDALEEPNLPPPDGLMVLSPMIAVTPAAAAGRSIARLGAIPYFEKSRWLDLMPEYMPYKYNSFPANAAYQSHVVSTRLVRSLARAEANGSIGRLPPLLAFQSVVDATVSTPAVVDMLYNRLRGPGHELVLFNVNTGSNARDFIRAEDLRYAHTLFRDDRRNYRLSLLANAEPNTRRIAEYSAEPGHAKPKVRALGLEWPAGVYSLSHVAVPMPADDEVYGLQGEIGGAAPRGEKGVLTGPIDQFMRLYGNPFFSYVEDKIEDYILHRPAGLP